MLFCHGADFAVCGELLEEVVAFVVHQNKGREIFDFDFTQKRMIDGKLCLISEIDIEIGINKIYAAKISAETL